MMRYMISVIDDQTSAATPSEMAAIDVFNDRLKAEDHWVFAAGLALPSAVTVIDNRGGEPVFGSANGRPMSSRPTGRPSAVNPMGRP